MSPVIIAALGGVRRPRTDISFSYKNFRCAEHDKFFEVNLYQKDPMNKHHWRSDLARPATLIDL